MWNEERLAQVKMSHTLLWCWGSAAYVGQMDNNITVIVMVWILHVPVKLICLSLEPYLMVSSIMFCITTGPKWWCQSQNVPFFKLTYLNDFVTVMESWVIQVLSRFLKWLMANFILPEFSLLLWEVHWVITPYLGQSLPPVSDRKVSDRSSLSEHEGTIHCTTCFITMVYLHGKCTVTTFITWVGLIQFHLVCLQLVSFFSLSSLSSPPNPFHLLFLFSFWRISNQNIFDLIRLLHSFCFPFIFLLNKFDPKWWCVKLILFCILFVKYSFLKWCFSF
jgi:hypothetical protein